MPVRTNHYPDRPPLMVEGDVIVAIVSTILIQNNHLDGHVRCYFPLASSNMRLYSSKTAWMMSSSSSISK